MKTSDSNNQIAQEPDGYEPPKVEQVLTASQLAREIHYAGVDTEEAAG